MDNASDKKPLLSSNSSRESMEGSHSNRGSKEETKTKTESKKETKNESKKDPTKATPPVSGGNENEGSPTPNRVVRPTVQARPFSTKTKKVYWVFTIIHLIILLSVLFGISYGLLQFVFAQTKKGPLYWGTGTFIGGVPSIMFEPRLNSSVKARQDKGVNSTTIKFTPGSDNSSYAEYVKRLLHAMNRSNETVDRTRCLNTPENNVWIGTRTDQFCVQEVNATRYILNNQIDNVCASPNMGYDKGTPCFLIRLTKLLGFFPMSDNQDRNEVRPTNSEYSCDEKIKFNCSAKYYENDTDKGSDVTMLVPDGIPFCHFPFWNQKGYTAPYILIRPKDPLPKGTTVIKCVPLMKTLKKLSHGAENKVEIIVYSEFAQNSSPNSSSSEEEIGVIPSEKKKVPSMMFEPMQTGTNEIRFESNSNSSFMSYVERLRKIMNRPDLSEVERRAQERCNRDGGDLFLSDWSGKETKEYCNQKIGDSLPRIVDSKGERTADQICSHNSELFGYNDSTPCLLIGLTKEIGFYPMSDNQLETGVTPSVKDNPCMEKIKFDCTADHYADVTSESPDQSIEMLVGDGIGFCHFPFWNQKGYLSPFIMIRPKDPLPKGKTVITCSPALKSLKKLSNSEDNKIGITVYIKDEKT